MAEHVSSLSTPSLWLSDLCLDKVLRPFKIVALFHHSYFCISFKRDSRRWLSPDLYQAIALINLNLLLALTKYLNAWSLDSQIFAARLKYHAVIIVLIDTVFVFFHSFIFSNWRRSCDGKLYILAVICDLIETEIVFAHLTPPCAKIFFLLMVHLP